MKNCLPLFLILYTSLFFTQNIFAQSWEKTFEQNGALSKGFDVLETSDGGYVLCGEVDLPTGAIRHYIKTVKTDAAGNQLWSRIYNYNAISNDAARSLIETSDGGFLIASSNIDGNAQLLRINANGDSLWTKTYDLEGLQTVESIIDNPNGDGYFMAGSSPGNVDLGESSFWLISLDDEGVLLWENTYMEFSAVGSTAMDIKAAADGDLLVAGGFGDFQTAVLRVAANGDQLWAKKYSLSTADVGLAIEEMANSDILVGGYITGFAGNSPSLLRLDANGEQLVSQPIVNLAVLGAISDIEADVDGGYVLVGSGFSFWNGVDGDNGFILKMNNNLEAVWDSLLKVGVQGTSILPTSDNGYIMSGYDYSKMVLKKIGGITNADENVLLEKELAIMVYPNPATEKLIFELPVDAITASLNVTLYSADGRFVKTQMIDEGVEVVELGNLSAGNYSYVVKQKGVLMKSGWINIL